MHPLQVVLSIGIYERGRRSFYKSEIATAKIIWGGCSQRNIVTVVSDAIAKQVCLKAGGDIFTLR